jgi:hypothetical protein
LAAEKVKERLKRATAALDVAGVPYAVVGGHAVADWVGRVDEAAVRNTADVDILIRRSDLEAAKATLATAGFVHTRTLSLDIFLDGPNGRARDAVHILYAGEKVRPEHLTPAPEVTDSERTERYQLVLLEPLVYMKLNSFRTKDQMHLRDMLSVGLIDQSWTPRLPAPLASRLQQLLDNPED